MFTHLHLHTEYSLLDGLTRISPLMDHVREIGQEAVAMTDHGAMYGAVDFYREAKARGIKPIIGVEAYVAPGSRLTRETGDKQPFHLTLLARNKTGYRNLLKLVTSSHLEGYYYRPRMDRDILAQYGEGIIALSGCPSGEMHRLIAEGRLDEARSTANWYREVFDGYYFELMEHDMPEFRSANRALVELSREMGVPLVATNDSHYLTREDHESQDILLCIQTNSTVLDEKRMRMSDPSYYVKSEAEMLEMFSGVPEAISNSWKIADSCDLDLEFDRLHLPQPELPPGETSVEYLERLCWEGLRRRLPGAPPSSEERLRYELEVVEATGFTNYIHIVREIGMFARARGIRLGVRGSAAASLILYCLGVTDIDPLAAGLVFERFLNKERPEAPDVDFDFAEDRREEVFRFVADRYGADRVAQIITFGTMGAKAAIRDVGRALGMTYADVDRVARLIPNALHMTLERALNESGDLRQAYEADGQIRTLVDSARKLEGVARNSSTHAAGVVISSGPLVEHLPLARPSRGEAQAMPTTQFTMENVAAIGLIKMDLLGLANLTILDRAVQLIAERHGVKVELENLPDGDPHTFESLATGDTFGVFQLESAGMRRAVIELKPTKVADLAALVALYRPGPMQHIGTFCRAKHGIEQVTYPHADLADILDETYGVIVFQDQVLKIAQKFGGYSLGAADIMRKAMGKKIAYLMQEQRERFIAGALEKGYSLQDAEKVFDLIEPFAGYAFNKAHSFSYGTIAYQTAWLKAHYPEEYLCAVLMQAASHPAGALARIGQAYNECLRLGIPVLAPDVNHSGVNFAIEGRDDGKVCIRFGLGMIKNVGSGAAEAIIESRKEGFASLDDFCRRLNTNNVNKRAIESLVKSGALDSIAGSEARGSLLINLDRIVSIATNAQKLRETGQATMFDLFGDEVATPLAGLDLQNAPVPKGELLAWEKELIGVWLSEHPYTHAAPVLAPYVTIVSSDVTPELMEDAPSQGRDFVLAGTVGSSRRLTTRDGRAFIAAELEDLSGTIEVTVWPDVYERAPEIWSQGSIVLVQVRIRERGERISAGVQQAVRYTDDFVAPAWALEGMPAPAPAAFSNGRSNGNGHRPAAADAVAPTPTTERAVPQSPAEPEAAVNGNGHRPAAVDAVAPIPSILYAPTGEHAVSGRKVADVSAAPSPLQLTLEESEDEAGDQRRLAEVFRLLEGRPGPDSVYLTVRTRDGDDVELALPQATLDDELRSRLQKAVIAELTPA